MTQKEYTAQAEEMYNASFNKTTPKGQNFNIGDVVKIVKPTSWFSKDSINKNKDFLYKIEYSYQQKYGHLSMSKSSKEKHLNRYSLIKISNNKSSAWYDGDELELQQ